MRFQGFKARNFCLGEFFSRSRGRRDTGRGLPPSTRRDTRRSLAQSRHATCERRGNNVSLSSEEPGRSSILHPRPSDFGPPAQRSGAASWRDKWGNTHNGSSGEVINIKCAQNLVLPGFTARKRDRQGVTIVAHRRHRSSIDSYHHQGASIGSTPRAVFLTETTFY